MNLLEIRTWFTNESGRFDLVTDVITYADNGADNHLRAGLRMLDRMVTTPKSMARNFQMIAIDGFYVTFDFCRAIKEVWVADIESRWKLEKKDMQWMREEYADIDLESGQSLYYAPMTLRAHPETDVTPVGIAGGYLGYLDIMVGGHYNYNGVLIYPPTDIALMVETWGYFYSKELALDTDENYWTVQHPELVVMAAQCNLEKFQRNSEGVKDWITAIKLELDGIDKDVAEEVSAEISVMEG
jgi:hypothetical protein